MRKIIVAMTAVIMMMSLCSCNKSLIDTTYSFDEAIIYMNGEYVTVQVSSWKDYNDGDQIQVEDSDGNVYLVHSSNITLIKHSK